MNRFALIPIATATFFLASVANAAGKSSPVAAPAPAPAAEPVRDEPAAPAVVFPVITEIRVECRVFCAHDGVETPTSPSKWVRWNSELKPNDCPKVANATTWVQEANTWLASASGIPAGKVVCGETATAIVKTCEYYTVPLANMAAYAAACVSAAGAAAAGAGAAASTGGGEGGSAGLATSVPNMIGD